MSTPLFQEFDPRRVPWQWQAVQYARDFDYTTGVLETFSSGSVGSAKTIKDIHEIVKVCLENPGSRWLLLRRALKDLKRTSWKVLLQHMADIPHVVKSYNKTDMLITFVNGSEIMGDSYHDGDLTKFQSLELSGVDYEEINECPRDVYDAVKLRVGRLPSVKVNRIQGRCNPEGPSHWLYPYFIEEDGKHANRKVFYSLTEQNPFLPKWYIENLKRDLDPKMAQRKLYGKWVEINKEIIYYAYQDANNYSDTDYVVDPQYPIHLAWDFNIGHGKPLSMVCFQYIHDHFHYFGEVVIEGARTLDSLEELDARGILDYKVPFFEVNGDATGEARSTKSIHSDYDIIKKFLGNREPKISFKMNVPRANPPIKTRHNKFNAYLENEAGNHRITVYKSAPTLRKGLKLTALKKGGNYIEDDANDYQHVTTAAGYGLMSTINKIDMSKFNPQRG